MSTRLEKRPIAKVAAYTIKPSSGDRSGCVFTNRAAVGSVTFTLPTPNAGVKGWWYEFFVHADQSLIVAGAAAGAIAVNGNAAADNVGFQVASKKIGGRIIAMCDGTQWLCFGIRPGGGFCVNGTEAAIDDSVTAGTAVASRAVVLDANKSIDAGMVFRLGAAVTVASPALLGLPADVSSNASGTVQSTFYTLNSVVLPANALSANGKGIKVKAWGTTAGNANAKDFKLIFGGATITLTTGNTGNAVPYYAEILIYRTAAGAQVYVGFIIIGTNAPIPVQSTTAADETTAWTVAFQSQNTAAAAASATGKGMAIEFQN